MYLHNAQVSCWEDLYIRDTFSSPWNMQIVPLAWQVPDLFKNRNCMFVELITGNCLDKHTRNFSPSNPFWLCGVISNNNCCFFSRGLTKFQSSCIKCPMKKSFCKYLMSEICTQDFLWGERESSTFEIHWNIYDVEKHYDSTWQINVNFQRGKQKRARRACRNLKLNFWCDVN